MFRSIDSNLYYIRQLIEESDVSRRLYTYTVYIPDLMWLLDNQTNREIRTTKSTDKEDKFQVKIKFAGRENELIEVYYKSCKFTSIRTWSGIWMIRDNVFIYKSGTQHMSKLPYQHVNQSKWQFQTMLYKSKLNKDILQKEMLCIQFKFEVNTFSTVKIDSQLTLYNPENEMEVDVPTTSNCNLGTDLKNLLLNTKLSDVTIKTADGDELPAHKNILISRSLVFKAHFEHNTLESITNVIECPFQTDVVTIMLSYIYTDNAPNIDKLLQKLLSAADFYEINGLKNLCEIALVKKLTVENAVETLQLAHLGNAMYLKRKTIEFIKDGLIGEISKTEGWKKLRSAEVAKSIYVCVVENKTV